MYEKIVTFLLTSSFKKNVANTNVYIMLQKNQLMTLVLYVDDATLISNDVDGLLKQFKYKLAKEFATIDLGHIQYRLGI